MSHKTRITSQILLLACFFAAESCVTDSFAPHPGIIEEPAPSKCHYSVSVSLSAASVAPSETIQASTSIASLDGTPVTGAVTWSSSNASIATVSSSGVVTGLAVGTATIQASLSDCSGTALVDVKTKAVVIVVASVDSASLVVGHSAQASAVAKDSAGDTLAGETAVWTSLTPSIAAVSSTGLVTAVGAGMAQLQATVSAVNGLVSLPVTAPPTTPPPPPDPSVASVTVTLDSSALMVGHTSRATATARDVNGTVMTGQTVTWTSLTPSAASVSSSGIVTAVGAGTATIQGTVSQISGTASVAVTAPPPPPPTVASVTVTIDSTNLLVGHTARATATARDASGNIITGQPVTWTSLTPAFATISATGVITGVAAGAASVRASVGTISGSAALTIKAPPPTCASVTVSIDSATLMIGHTAQASGVVKDAAGNPITGLTMTWTSLSPTLASVTSTGRITALAVGIAMIQASAGGCSGTKSLSVTTPPPVGTVASVSVAIDSATLAAGNQSQASAVPKDAAGNVVSGQTVTWTSLTPTIASVSASGVVQALTPGAAQIQATVASTTGSAQLTVVAIPDLASVNFNDGTYGVLSPFDPDGSVSIVDDPTGSGRGKVVRIHYVGINQDRNRSVVFTYPPGIGLGKTIFSRHRVYHVGPLNTNTFIGRKYIYWQEGDPSLGLNFAGQPFWSVVGLNGTEVAVDLGHFNSGGTVAQTVSNNIYAPKMQADTWYTIETQMTINSTPSSNDGIFRLWINGALIYEKTNWSWTDPNWGVNFANFGFHFFSVGDQVSYTQGSFDEIRLIDDVAFSTKRIGQ